MSEKIGEAQSHIDGTSVAQMIIDFNNHFRGVYPLETMASSLCAVGPLQSMIGLAIANGRLTALSAQATRFLKYGENWRYVYELEKEVGLHRLRRKAMIWVAIGIFLMGLLIGRIA